MIAGASGGRFVGSESFLHARRNPASTSRISTTRAVVGRRPAPITSRSRSASALSQGRRWPRAARPLSTRLSDRHGPATKASASRRATRFGEDEEDSGGAPTSLVRREQFYVKRSSAHVSSGLISVFPRGNPGEVEDHRETAQPPSWKTPPLTRSGYCLRGCLSSGPETRVRKSANFQRAAIKPAILACIACNPPSA